MIKIEHLQDIPKLKSAAMTIGTYDGLHIGHRKIIEDMINRCKNENIPSILMTFKEHPLSIFELENPPECIGTSEIRDEYFLNSGIDYLLMIDFSLKIANITHKSFLDFLLNKVDNLRLHLGFNFRFGKGNLGNIDYLREVANAKPNNLDLVEVEPIKYEDKVVSSSLIRDLIHIGNVELVERLLHRPYRITEEVVYGAGMGRKIGFPTINQKTKKQVLPRFGVYKTSVLLGDKLYPSMTFVGRKSTDLDVDKANIPLVETHIFDFKGNLYRQNISVLFEKFIREDKKLGSFSELVAQLKEDKQKCLEDTSLGGKNTNYAFR